MLKGQEHLSPMAIVLSLLLVLSIVIILGQFFHQSLQEEMAGQFNRQQLLLAREVSMNVANFIDRVAQNIRVLSHIPDIQHIDHNPRARSILEAINFTFRDEAVVTIRVLDKEGRLLYDSTYPGRENADLSRTDWFRKAQVLPRNEKLITGILDEQTPGLDAKEFIVATSIYRRNDGEDLPEFDGVVLAVLSLDGLTRKYLAPIKSGRRGYAWMIDADGTLLYHPTQPRMVGKNLYRTDRTCFNCHVSFDAEKKMIEGTTETFGYYEAPGGENKLAAFYKLQMGRNPWIVVVSAPYSDVIALMRQSRILYSLLIVSILLITLAASAAAIVTNKKKIKADEQAKHFENLQRLEREIEIQKDYLENIVENTKTNLLVLDQDLKVRTLNSSQARTLGLPKQAVLGKPFLSLFPFTLPPYEGMPLETLMQKTIMGHTFEIRDYQITPPGSTPLYLSMNFSPLLIDGTIPGILITSNNVTKRVQLEEALKEYAVELEDKVAQGIAAAQTLEQQVMHSEKLAALGRLAAGVAHEIGNPLASISSFAQILRQSAEDDFSRESLDIINTHIQRITDIVRRMSSFARADAVTVKSVQLNDLLKEALDLLRLDKRMKSSVTIDTSLDADLPRVMIDEGKMSQVFINIIINALDAMAEGGTLHVATQRGGGEEEASVMISFSDTGSGIPSRDLDKIFDPFYTTKEPGKGTGLGLSLSYTIIKQFKGDIKVESAVGQGTTFTIVLPVEKTATA